AAGATLEASKANDTWTVKFDSRGGASVVSTAGGLLTLTGAGNGIFDKVLSGAGGITKSGAGTWTLSRLNTHTGATAVLQGKLVLQNAALADSSTLSVSSGAKVALNFSGSDTVSSLRLGGILMSPGLYNISHPQYGSFFEGAGSIIVPGTPNA